MDELSTLPIVESKEYESTWHVRIHTELTVVKVKVILRDMELKKWVFAVEHDANRRHIHLYIPDMDEKPLRKLLKEKFNLQGNKEYSMSKQRSRSLLSYVVKGKEVYSFGIERNVIQDAMDVSVEKYDKIKFTKELKEIEGQYILKRITAVEFVKAYGDLKNKYGQSINVRWIKDRLYTLRWKIDERFRNKEAISIVRGTFNEWGNDNREYEIDENL